MKIKEIKFKEDKSGRTIMVDPKKNLSGVYLLFNRKMELIYIGQTSTLRSRIWAHVSKNNSKRIEWKSGDWNYSSKLKIGEAFYFLFSEIEDKLIKNMVESSLIYFFKPKYNGYCEEFNKKLNGEED